MTALTLILSYCASRLMRSRRRGDTNVVMHSVGPSSFFLVGRLSHTTLDSRNCQDIGSAANFTSKIVPVHCVSWNCHFW